MRCDLLDGTRVYVGANGGGFTWAHWESDGGQWYVTAEGLRADVAELAGFIESL